MSSREKKLLIFFACAGFIVLNFLGFGFFQSKRLEVTRARDQARRQLDTAEMYRASREQVQPQMEWLASHEPEPAADQDVKTKLQQLCESEAKSVGLEIKSQNPQPTDAAEGRHYHRAKIEISLSGKEEALYRWFDRINVPDQLRAATLIHLSPNQKDDTLIDCKATVEQWFVPLPPSA
jgi:hypothetical protein